MFPLVISVIVPIAIIVTLVVVIVVAIVVVVIVGPVAVSVVKLSIIVPVSSVIIVWSVIIVSVAAPSLFLGIIFECFGAVLLIVSLFVRAICVVAGEPPLVILLPLPSLVSSPTASSSSPSPAPAIALIMVFISTLISWLVVATTLIRTVGLFLLEAHRLPIAPSRTRGFLFLLGLFFRYILARWISIASIPMGLLGWFRFFLCYPGCFYLFIWL